MVRPLRIEFDGAIYHLMARGNARQAIFSDDADRQRLLDGLEQTVHRCDWELFGFVWMPNHIHLFLRTPRPNLSRGMQRLLSGYANWYAKRHRRPGHLFQGRFKGELIEDESHFWAVSRYVHLNPVRGKRPLVGHPRDWPWSSYGGFANKRKRVAWVAYDAVLQAWQGTAGGLDPAAAYRRYVEEGLADPPESPFAKAVQGWLLGSETFAAKMRYRMKSPRFDDEVPKARRLIRIDADAVFSAVACSFDVAPEIFPGRGNSHIARASAAWLARRLTSATLRDLSFRLGLGRPESVSNLTRRIDRAIVQDAELKRRLRQIESELRQETKNKA